MGTPPSCATLPDVSLVFLQVQIIKLPVTLVLRRKFPAAPPQLPGVAPQPLWPPHLLQSPGGSGEWCCGCLGLVIPRDRRAWGEVCTGEAKNTLSMIPSSPAASTALPGRCLLFLTVPWYICATAGDKPRRAQPKQLPQTLGLLHLPLPCIPCLKLPLSRAQPVAGCWPSPDWL